MQTIHFYNARWKALLLTFGSGLFVAAGIFILLKADEEDYLLGWGCSIFFGLCALVGLFQLFDRRPRLTLDEQGLTSFQIKSGRIKWEAIEQVFLTNINNQKYISLRIHPDYKLTKGKKSKWHERAEKLNQSLGFEEINIHVSPLKVKTKKLADFIAVMAESDENKRAYLIQNAAL